MMDKNNKQRGGNRRPQTFKKCRQCGQLFGPLQRLSMKFCSIKCKGLYFRGRPSAKKGKKYPHLRTIRPRKCKICLKNFWPKGDMNGKLGGKVIRKQIYCSKKCWNVRSILKKTECENCHKTYIPTADTSGRFCSRICAYKFLKEEKHHHFKGEMVGYSGLHKWVALKLGKPKKCEDCGKDGLIGQEIHWANISGQYRRELDDWIRLCAKCHKAFDADQICLKNNIYKNGQGIKIKSITTNAN